MSHGNLIYARRIRFFYDGNFAEQTTLIVIGEEKKARSTNSFTMTYAAMYAIADKYEAPALRNISLQKIQDLYKGRPSFMTLEIGIQVIYHEVALPASDSSLRDILVQGWMRTFKEAKYHDRGRLEKLCKADEEFRADVEKEVAAEFFKARST